MTRRIFILALSASCLLLVIQAVPVYAQDKTTNEEVQAPALDPKADAIIRDMSDFLVKQNKFRLEAENSLDVVLDSGQKLQFNISGEVFVRRPNALKATRKGAVIDQEFYYDGAKLTIYRKALGFYATADAPPTIDEALDYAIDELGIVAPAADLLYSNAYKALMADAESSYYVGETLIHGVKCHHLAFRTSKLDWQIWVESGKTPVPRKFIITAKLAEGAPQFTAEYSTWDFSPELQDNSFTFVPPKDSYQIGFAKREKPLPAGTEGEEP